jgi:hypothetical protein
MGEDVQNEHSLGLVIHPGNQPVVVAMDIENSPSAHDVRMREVLSYIGQRAPVRSLSDPIPVQQRDQSIPVPLGKLENGWLANDPHDTSLQNVNPSGQGARRSMCNGEVVGNHSLWGAKPLGSVIYKRIEVPTYEFCTRAVKSNPLIHGRSFTEHGFEN